MLQYGRTIPGGTMPSTEPKRPIPDKCATIHDYLEYEHPLVQGLNLTPEAAAKLKIGYKPTGLLTGRVVFPLYAEDEHGKPKLVSYMGWHPDKDPPLEFPPSLSKRI
jgi:hypothetical protein